MEVEFRNANSLAEDLADDILDWSGDVGRKLVAQRLEYHQEVWISMHSMGGGICSAAFRAVAVLPRVNVSRFSYVEERERVLPMLDVGEDDSLSDISRAAELR